MSVDQRKEVPVQAAAEPAGGPPLPTPIESLFREHHARVYRAAYRVTGNPMDADLPSL